MCGDANPTRRKGARPVSILTHIKERIHARLYGDQGEGHPSVGYDSKIERWREHPLETEAHHGHERSTTKAHYGDFVVCYCYDCKTHYRQLKSNLDASVLPQGSPTTV